MVHDDDDASLHRCWCAFSLVLHTFLDLTFLPLLLFGRWIDWWFTIYAVSNYCCPCVYAIIGNKSDLEILNLVKVINWIQKYNIERHCSETILREQICSVNKFGGDWKIDWLKIMMFIFAITSILVLQVAYKALAYSSISSNPLVQRQVISTLFSSARPITYRSIEVPIAKR